MSRPLLLLVLSLLLATCATTKSGTTKSPESAAAYQADLNNKYTDPATSILKGGELALLQDKGGLPFFPVNDDYRVKANFKRHPNPEVVEFPTSTDRMASYAAFGRATFELNGKKHHLTLYRSTSINLPLEYQNMLFVPFRDETSGKETYGGGRYMDVEIPRGNTIVIDFNKSYHPYCAYTDGYSCPVPPAENTLDTKVMAGIKTIDLGDH